jgi:hypothetical protein
MVLIVSSVPYRSPRLPAGAGNLLNAIVSDYSVESISGLRTRLGLNDQGQLFTGAPREEHVSGNLVWSPAPELVAIEPSEAAAFYTDPQEAVLVLSYAEYRCGR